MTMSFSGGAGVGFGSESPATGVAVFELAAGPLAGRDLEVVSFRGREKISRLFWFDILIVTRLDSEIVESTLGQPAVLSIRSSEGASRAVRGIVASVAPEATSTPDGRHAYRFRIVPRLWLLKHRITSRIFQNQDVPAIIEAVLEAAGVPGRVAVSRSYPARAYCVQYKESDYDFIRRLLAEEGIFYFFDFLSGFFGPSGPGDAAAEVVVFADDPAAYPPIAASAGKPAPSATPGVKMPSPHLHLRQVRGLPPRSTTCTTSCYAAPFALERCCCAITTSANRCSTFVLMPLGGIKVLLTRPIFKFTSTAAITRSPR
jgi:uncharacterized protein involved in type VI secretion and phage assembly